MFDGIGIAGLALQIRPNADAMARYGLTNDLLHASIEHANTGTVVDRLRVGARLYDVRIFSTAESGLARHSKRVEHRQYSSARQ